VEREIMLTGIGGQSVQLAAQILARAAIHEGREVMLLGSYGGSMRGSNTDSTLVVSDRTIESPPIVARTWAALAMHHAFWAPTAAKLRPGSVVVVNASIFEAPLDRDAHRVFEVPATRIATELGSPLAAALVLAAAFAGLTHLVGVDALVEGMKQSVPPYRRQHLEANEKALRAGYTALPGGAAHAWEQAA
jgi:Pyruvate/2-oxoacid:ferredoxin oxidoreductase gamma subunit